MKLKRGIHRLALVALACAGLGLASLPATSAASARRVEIHVTPGTRGPVILHVRASKGSSLRATLNGHSLGRFGPWIRGHRNLHVSPTFGLRFGTNVLKLRRRNRGERQSQHFRFSFQVPRTHPLAAAGYDRSVTVGEPITLDGTKSLSHTAARAAAAGRSGLRFRWRIVHAPRGSRVRRPKRAHKAAAGDTIPLVPASAADVNNADSSTAELVPDVPGTYRTELAVTGSDGRTGVDQADVNVVNPPMVPIETMAQFTGRPSPAPPPPTATPPDQGTTTSTTPQGTTTSTTDQTATTTTTTTTTTTAPSETTATTTTPPTTGQGPVGTTAPSTPTTTCRFETTDAGIADGTPGVRIGSMFCPGDSTSWLQVVVLDRKTLVPQLNKSYSDPSKVADVQHDLAQYDSSSLVIAVNQPPSLGAPCPSCAEWKVQPGGAFNDALGRIGVQAPEPSGNPLTALRGRFSAIGVPTYPATEAYVNAPKDLADNRFNGDISGNLIVDNNLNYTLMPPRVAFNTQDVGSGLGQNVVRVGGDTYTAPLDLDANQNGQGGFQVVVLDRTGLGTAVGGNNRSGNSYTCPALTDPSKPNSGPCYWFPTGLWNYDSGEGGRLNAMAAYLAKANAGDNEVIITSRGNPAIQAAGQESRWGDVDDAAKSLVDQIEALGGTRTEAYQALSPPPAPKAGLPYTLIGSSNAGAAQGTETQGPKVVGKAALNTVPLAGAFEPGHDYRYGVTETAPSPLAVQGTDVVSTDTVHIAGEKLRETLVQAPQPWPDLNPAAIAYIEGKLYNAEDLRAGRTIRTDYWNPPSAISDASWQGTQAKIDAVAWPGGQPGFSAKELSDAESEFHSEISWLINVRGFTRALAQPFTDSGLTVWGDQNGIGAAISGLVQPAQDNVVSSVASKILIGVAEVGAEVAAAIPGVGQGVEAVAAGVFSLITVYDLVLEVTDVAADKSADEPFSVHASEVASHLQETLKTAQATLTNQFTNAIVADYGKLKAIGQCTGATSVDCPDSSASWSFNDKDRVAATNAVRIGASIETYTDLLPAQYQLYQLSQTCPGSTNEKCWEGNFQGDGFYSQAVLAHICPFLTEPNSAKLVRPFRRDIPFYRNNQGFNGDAPTDTWQAYALGTLKGGPSEGKVWTMDLVGSDYLATGRKQLPGLFAPLDPGGDFNKGGLGAQPEEVFLRAFPNPILMATAGSPHAPGQTVQPFPVRESQGPFWGGRDVHCVAQP